jgi:hypothetical protein
MEDGCLLVLTLEKGCENIWKTILKGDSEIDATKVDNSKSIHDFDDETQVKIIFYLKILFYLEI